MSKKGTVTKWIDLIRAGDTDAAQKLWERYFESLVEQARRQLRSRGRTLDDEEDVALQTFEALFSGLRDGKFPKLSDRNGLWALLLTISRAKTVDAFRWSNRDKRRDVLANNELLSETIGLEPTPEFSAGVADELRVLLDLLDSEELRTVAIRRMEGYSVQEIAEELGCVVRTVERRLQAIRIIWSESGRLGLE